MPDIEVEMNQYIYAPARPTQRVVRFSEIASKLREALLLDGTTDSVWKAYREDHETILSDDRLLEEKPSLN